MSSSQPIESLEARTLLSSTTTVALHPLFNLAAAGGPVDPHGASGASGSGSAVLAPAAAKATKAAKRNTPKGERARVTALTTTDVQNIIAAGASQMKPTQAI